MGVFTALRMAARRWYLLIPLVLTGVGVSWLAYLQMPASYSASVVHEVKAAEPAAASSSTSRHGLTLAQPPTSPDPVERTSEAADELVGSVRPAPPAGTLPGRAGAQPITMTRHPDPSSITVRAVADSAAHARDAVEAVSTQLTDRLREIDEERGPRADEQLSLATSSPLTVQPPIRTVGRKVFMVTLAFCLALSVVLAAAVERSARRRRLLLAEAEADRDEADSGDNDTDVDPGGTGSDRSRDQTADQPEPMPDAEPALLSGAEPALLADAKPPLSAGYQPVPAVASATGDSPAVARAVPDPDDGSAPTELVPVMAHADDEPSTAVIPVAVEPASAGPPPGTGRGIPRTPPPGSIRGRERQRTGGHPTVEPSRGPVPRSSRPQPPRGGRPPMEPRPAPEAELPMASWVPAEAPVGTDGWLPPAGATAVEPGPGPRHPDGWTGY